MSEDGTLVALQHGCSVQNAAADHNRSPSDAAADHSGIAAPSDTESNSERENDVRTILRGFSVVDGFLPSAL